MLQALVYRRARRLTSRFWRLLSPSRKEAPPALRNGSAVADFSARHPPTWNRRACERAKLMQRFRRRRVRAPAPIRDGERKGWGRGKARDVTPLPLRKLSKGERAIFRGLARPRKGACSFIPHEGQPDSRRIIAFVGETLAPRSPSTVRFCPARARGAIAQRGARAPRAPRAGGARTQTTWQVGSPWSRPARPTHIGVARLAGVRCPGREQSLNPVHASLSSHALLCDSCSL